MKVYNMKANKLKQENYTIWFIVGVVGLMIAMYTNKDIESIELQHTYNEPELVEIVPIAVAPISHVLDPLEPVRIESDDLAGIKRVYGKYATKKLNSNVEWLYELCIERGLKPSLVFAVQAKESTWGRSYHCINSNNCFGYDYSDSSPNTSRWEGDDYRDVTASILERYMVQGYGVSNAYVMAKAGYNFHEEWAIETDEIESYFN